MEGVHGGLHGVAVEDDHVLDRLLRLAEHVDDVLGQLAAEDGRDGRDLAAQVLEEAAQELGPQRLAGQAERLVLLGGDLGEELQVLSVAREAVALDLLEFPEGAEAGQRRRDGFQAPLGGGVLAREDGHVAGEEPRRVELALADGFDGFAAVPLGLDVGDGAGARFLLGRRGDVAGLAGDDVVVLDEVAEDEAVHAMRAGGVERPPVDSRGRVDDVECARVQVGCDDNVVGSKVAGALCRDAFGVYVYLDSGVELAECVTGCLGAVLADEALAAFGEEELAA